MKNYINLTAKIEISKFQNFPTFQSENLIDAFIFVDMTEIQVKMLMILKNDHRQILKMYGEKTIFKKIVHYILITIDN